MNLKSFFVILGFYVVFEAQISVWLIKHLAKVLRYQFIFKEKPNTMMKT